MKKNSVFILFLFYSFCIEATLLPSYVDASLESSSIDSGLSKLSLGKSDSYCETLNKMGNRKEFQKQAVSILEAYETFHEFNLKNTQYKLCNKEYF